VNEDLARRVLAMRRNRSVTARPMGELRVRKMSPFERLPTLLRPKMQFENGA